MSQWRSQAKGLIHVHFKKPVVLLFKLTYLFCVLLLLQGSGLFILTAWFNIKFLNCMFSCEFFVGEKQWSITSEMLRQSTSFLKVVNTHCRNVWRSFLRIHCFISINHRGGALNCFTTSFQEILFGEETKAEAFQIKMGFFISPCQKNSTEKGIVWGRSKSGRTHLFSVIATFFFKITPTFCIELYHN